MKRQCEQCELVKRDGQLVCRFCGTPEKPKGFVNPYTPDADAKLKAAMNTPIRIV